MITPPDNRVYPCITLSVGDGGRPEIATWPAPLGPGWIEGSASQATRSSTRSHCKRFSVPGFEVSEFAGVCGKIQTPQCAVRTPHHFSLPTSYNLK